MHTSTVQLAEGFYPQDMWSWYNQADIGESVTITLPSRNTAVRLIKGENNHVRWWPEGGCGMTVTLQDARLRLEMLRETRSGLTRTATRD